MARFRTIKPSFFLNEDVAHLSPMARLLFIGLWCVADRRGRLEDRPERIKAELFPYDRRNLDEMLLEVSRWHFIERYEVDGRKYIQIVNFEKHQKPHPREAESTIPANTLDIQGTDLSITKAGLDPAEPGGSGRGTSPSMSVPSMGNGGESLGSPRSGHGPHTQFGVSEDFLSELVAEYSMKFGGADDVWRRLRKAADDKSRGRSMNLATYYRNWLDGDLKWVEDHGNGAGKNVHADRGASRKGLRGSSEEDSAADERTRIIRAARDRDRQLAEESAATDPDGAARESDADNGAGTPARDLETSGHRDPAEAAAHV